MGSCNNRRPLPKSVLEAPKPSVLRSHYTSLPLMMAKDERDLRLWKKLSDPVGFIPGGVVPVILACHYRANTRAVCQLEPKCKQG